MLAAALGTHAKCQAEIAMTVELLSCLNVGFNNVPYPICFLVLSSDLPTAMVHLEFWIAFMEPTNNSAKARNTSAISCCWVWHQCPKLTQMNPRKLRRKKRIKWKMIQNAFQCNVWYLKVVKMWFSSCACIVNLKKKKNILVILQRIKAFFPFYFESNLSYI